MITVLIVILVSQCKMAQTEIITLFEENANDWNEGGEAQWRFVDNELIGTATGGSGFVITKESYENLELTLEFYPDSTVNSGIFVRCTNRELSDTDCYEMNIWDLHPDQKSRTGSVVSRAVPEAHVETLDQWNTYKIICKGNHIQTWVNEVLTVDIENKDLVNGYIALQAAETGTIKFRNVRLKKLQVN